MMLFLGRALRAIRHSRPNLSFTEHQVIHVSELGRRRHSLGQKVSCDLATCALFAIRAFLRQHTIYLTHWFALEV
jgi:hypothetical protein